MTRPNGNANNAIQLRDYDDWPFTEARLLLLLKAKMDDVRNTHPPVFGKLQLEVTIKEGKAVAAGVTFQETYKP